MIFYYCWIGWLLNLYGLNLFYSSITKMFTTYYDYSLINMYTVRMNIVEKIRVPMVFG